MADCQNCGLELRGDYCYACGQKHIELARPFVELARDAIHESFDLDGRAWRTLRTLYRRPGRLTQAFLDGKRVRFTPPLRLYIFISVVFFLGMAWAAGLGLLLDPQQTVGGDSQMQAQFVSSRLPRMMFLLMPTFALLLKVVYAKRLFFDHLIFSLHIHCASYPMMLLALPLEQLSEQSQFALAAQVSVLIYFLIYLYIAMRRVYGGGWLMTLTKTLTAAMVYMVIVSLAIESAGGFLILRD